jgi:hypothetical protein
MAAGDLFEIDDIKQCRTPLSLADREKAVREVIRNADLGIKYFYKLREACGILHRSYDELNTILAVYKIDAVFFLDAQRIPWYDLCGYLLDEGDIELEEAFYEYLRSINRRHPGKVQTS